MAATGSQVVISVGLKGTATHPLSPLNLFRSLCLSVHRVTFATLLKTTRGAVFNHFSSYHTSSSLVKSGWGLSAHEWSFIQKARLDRAPLPHRAHPGIPPTPCGRCGLFLENIDHVLALCNCTTDLVNQRHDVFLWRLVRFLVASLHLPFDEHSRIESLIPAKQLVCNIKPSRQLYVNSTVPYLKDFKRPDLLFLDHQHKIAFIIDVRIVSEHLDCSFHLARSEKIENYTELAGVLTRRGYKVTLDAFLVGAFGSFDPMNLHFLKLLNIPQHQLELFIRFICSQVTTFACDIYHQYIL